VNAYTRLQPKPDASSVNTGVEPLHQKTVLSIFGAPRLATKAHPDLSEDGPVTNPKLAPKIVTASVGPFRVTGHKAAVDSLREIFAVVKAKQPELYKILGSAGMLNCRLVRGSKTSWSNHAFGFALDVTIGGELDKRGDDKVQAGLLLLYAVFHAHGWFWGTEFGIEDGMHFEAGDGLVRKWQAEGKL